MPYSVTTQDGFTLNDIPDELDPNSPEVLAEVDRLRERKRARDVPKKRAAPVFTATKADSSIPEDILKGFGSGITGMLESSALGMATLLEEDAELEARSKIQEFFDIDMLKGADEDSIAYKLSAGIGSIAALAPAALAGPAALPLAGVVAAGAGAGEASERARAYGATEDERNTAALKGTLIGASELLPLGRLSKAFKLPGLTAALDKLGPKAVESIGSRVRNAGVTGLAEGAQEGAAAILQNLTEQGYNPEQVLVDTGVLEEAAIGGGAGAILQALADVFIKGKERGTPKDGSIPAETTEEVDAAIAAAQVDLNAAAAEDAERLGANQDETKEVTAEEAGVTEADLAALETEEAAVTTIEPVAEVETPVTTDPDTESFNALVIKAKETDVDVVAELSLFSDDLESGKITRAQALAEVNTLVDAKIEAGGTNPAVVEEAAPVAVEEAAPVAVEEAAPVAVEEAAVEETAVEKSISRAMGTLTGDAPKNKAPALYTKEGELTPYGQEQSALKKQTKKEEENLREDKPLSPEAELADRAAAVGIDYKAMKVNLTTNKTKERTRKLKANEARAEIQREVEVLEAKATTDQKFLAENIPVVNKAITVQEGTGIGTKADKPADAVAVVDDKFVKSIGLTGRNATFGQAIVSRFGQDSDNTVSNFELAKTLKSANDATQATYDTAFETIELRESKKPQSKQLGSAAIKKEAQESITGRLLLDKKGQEYVNKYTGKKAKEAPAPSPATSDIKDEVILKKEGKLPEKKPEVSDAETTLIDAVDDMQAIASAKKDAEGKDSQEAATPDSDIDVLDSLQDDIDATLSVLNSDRSLLPNKAVEALDGVVTPSIKALLRKGDLRGALRLVSGQANDMRTKQIARVLSEAVGDSKVKFVKGENSFVSANGTVNLAEGPEVFIHTLLHEATHNVVDSTLANPSHPMTKQLTKLYNEVKPLLDSAYGTSNVKEFVAEALGNSKFQQKLAGMNPDGSPVNALERFFRPIVNLINSLLGRSTKPLGSALDIVDQTVIAFLATSPDTRGAGSTYANATRDGAKKIINELGLVQKSFAPPTKKFKDEFGVDGGSFLDSIGNSISNFATKLEVLRLLDSQAAGDVAKAKGYGDLGTSLHKLIQTLRGKAGEKDQIITARVEKAAKWAIANPEKQKIMDRLIYSRDHGATIHQVDPTIGTTTDPLAAKQKYGSSDAFGVWEAQRADWDALGKNGQDAYLHIRDTYKIQYEQMKKVITGRMVEVLGKEEADRLSKTVFDKMFDKSALDVYFPLVREGKFKLSYTPAETGSPRDDKDNYVVEMYESKKDRDKGKFLAKKAGATNMRTTDGELNARDYKNNAPPNSFVRDILSSLEKRGVAEEVQNEVMNLFIDSLPETSFAKSFKNRTGVEGYKHDAIYSMRAKAFDLSRQVVRIDYGGRIRAKVDEIETMAAELAVNNPNSTTTSAIGEDLKARADFALNGADNKTLEGVVKNANQLAFIYTIGFNASSAIVNLSQLPLFVAPMLGAEFGHIKTGKAMTKAMAAVTSSGNAIDSYFDITETADGDIAYNLKEGLDPKIAEEYGPLVDLITLASERSYLTQSYLADAVGLEEGTQTFAGLDWLKEKTGMKKSYKVNRGNVAEKGMNTVSAASAIMFNAGERFNRQVTLLTSYNLKLETIQAREIKKPKDQQLTTKAMRDEASEAALYMSQQYNGGAVLETGSRISSQSYGRVAFMYKNYGLRMYATMFQTGKTALDLQFNAPKNETAAQKEDRLQRKKVAWAQLRAIHLSSLLIAGVAGMPLYGAVSAILDLALDDDEEDADTVVRKYLSEYWFKGPLVDALGVDFSKRVRLNSLLFEANRYARDPSIEESLGHHLGGPAFSTGKRLMRAYDDFSEGEIERGLESALPGGLTNMLRNSPLGRFYKDEAMETRRGDVIYDDLTAGDFFAGMVGFPPTGYTFAQEQSNVEQKIDRAVSEKRSKLLKQYYVARRQGNYPETREVVKEIREFGKRHPSARIGYDTLKKSYKGHQRTTAKMHNGTTLSPLMKQVLEQERKNYDTSGLFD
mgnify:CR=1 FL=1